MVTVCGGEEWKDSKQVRREYPHNQFLDPWLTKGYLTWTILGSQRVNSHGVRTHPGQTALQVTPVPAVSRATTCVRNQYPAKCEIMVDII